MVKPAALPSPAALRDAAAQEIASLAALLAATVPGQSVHGARRRIKQLRSLLRLLRPAIGEASFGEANSALGEAADALAGHRRAEALVAAAGRLETPAIPSGFWCGLAAAHRESHGTGGEPGGALAAARQAVERAEKAIDATEVSAAAGPSAAFLQAYATARKRLRQGLRSGEAEALHEARKHVIHHLHQLQLVTPRRVRRLAALEELREALGDLNDLDELEQLAAGARVAPEDARRMAKARARLRHRAEQAAGRLFRHNPERWKKRLGHAAANVPGETGIG